jgi:hypothetical protein
MCKSVFLNFESGAFNHSATLPLRRRSFNQKPACGKTYFGDSTFLNERKT